MKKILLSLLALVAMAGMANAQRAWAYDLGLGYESDTYTFTFKATTAANATLIFTDAEGVELATHDAGAVVAGSNTIALTKAQLPEGTEIHWAVKMTGAAIALSGSYLTELTAAGQGLDFYLPQGVVVDNNPESETFSTLFIAEAQGGKLSVGPTHKQGIYHYSQKLAELNPTDQGIIPSNVTLTNGNRQEMHRIAINPKNNHVAFAHNISGKPAVWSVPANNPAGEATNLIAGTAITMPNSICFDENGVLYVMDNANATTGGTLYKVVDGVATKLVQNKTWQQVDNSLAYDGRGGIWIAQTSTGTTWPSYAILSHVNSSGEIDWSALDHSSDGLFSAGNEYGYSQRGQCAYNTKEDLLVLGGNCRSHIFQVTYNAAGAPSLTLKYRTPYLKASTNIDGAAFDYAGDLYLMSATRERLYKYAVPTDNNTCITPAPKAQVIVNSNAVVTYAISVTANAPAMGTVTGGGVYYPDETVRLTATPNEGHKFVNWSNGSTDNPLVFTATEDVELTANFEAFTYTITVASSDETKGTVAGGGTYAYNTTVTLTATANDGYEFAGWSNGSKANPLTINVKEDTELTANFRQVLATSITLNALPVQDYTPAIKGTIKRAVQNGENTIVLTHEADGTAHIYNIAHATQTVIEISQEGVNAAADGYLAISDIAVTDDGKLVACNYVHCTFTPSNTSYFYIWNDLAGDPTVWFTSQKSGNYNDAYMGYTMALKGTSQNAEVTISAFNKSNSNTRYSHLYVVNGEYTDDNYKYSKDNAALHPNTLGKNTYELNASPLAAGNWIVDGELASPIEFVEKNTVAIDTYTALNTDVLGKKYNGVSYLKNYNDHHFMIAPYTNEEGLLAGVKVIGITDGFAAPIVLATNTDLDVAVEATTAAATALVDAEGKLTIHLWADAKVYTFTEKTIAMYTIDAIPNNGAMGTITGSGSYLEGTQVTLTATPAEGYEFTCWTSGKDTVSTENPYKFTVTADVALVANFQATEPVVELPAASVRAWAYDLALAVEGEQYTFSYKATTAALATLIFTDVDGEELATKDLGLVEAGANTVVLAADELPAGQKVNWAVKLEAGAIAELAEVTDQTRGIYDFYNMMDVLVDNNPESDYFGRIYIQMAYDGANDAATDRSAVQKAGFYLYDQALNELNPESNVSIRPTLPEGYTMGDDRNKFHRLDIDPKTGNLTWCYNVAGQPAVFAVDAANLAGEATNLVAGIEGISRTAAHCFDAEGALYVMDLPAAGTIYKIVNGVATVFAATDSKWVNASMTLAADGKGGLWVAQNRGQIDTYYQLVHYTAEGAIDFAVYQGNENGFTGSSTRGALAYDVERQLLAQGRNGKVEVYSVAYDAETGVPTLTLVASTPYIASNIDGLHFDYAGDLYVVSSGSEKFYKYALPTATNVCTTPAASKYAFQNIEYDTMEITMTNLVVAEMGDYLVLTASDDSNTGLNVMLAVNEDGSLAADSYMAMVQGWNEVELPIVEGTITKTYSEELATDVYSGLVVVEYNEGYLGLDLTMYYVAPEYTDIVITNATVTEDIRDLGWGDETYTVLLLESTWSDGVETYPVLVEVNDYDLSVVEGTAVVSVTIGGQGDEDPWLGNVPDGEMKYTIADGVITLQGKLENASAWPAPVYWNLTISGKLPQGPTTALDNIAVEAKAIKMIKNGQLIIIKNGVQYNVQGAVIK